MFHSRCLNNKINRPYEWCLTITYSDKLSNFEELLNKDNSVSINQNNIHKVLHKVANGMPHEIMSEVFKLRDTPYYNLRHTLQFSYSQCF